MTATSARPSDYFVAVSAAVLVHAAFLVAFMVTMVFVINSEAVRKSRRPARPVLTVEIRPEYFSRVEEAEAAKALAGGKKFMRTDASQESAVRPDEAKFIGERDTLAASERAANPAGPEVPSQDGRERRENEQAQTFNSTFQEGEQPDTASRVPQEAPVPGMDELPRPIEEEVKGLAGEDREDRIGSPKEELLTTANQVPVPERAGEGDLPDKEMRPKESKAVSPAEAANVPGGSVGNVQAPVEEQPKEPGFRTEVRKTRLEGSIRRRGQSSLDVENSPLGRYQAKLSRAVENEWQRNCVRYRDHITPGFLTIRFLVDAKGRVTGLRFLDSVEAGEIQKGFTLKSIQNAAIPAMPKNVSDDLAGDPLELVYNFFF